MWTLTCMVHYCSVISVSMLMYASLHSGVKDILYKRLKSHLRLECISQDKTAPWELQNQCQTNPYNLDYLCILDFEATCEDPNPPDYIHEIIEFPVVLLNLKTLQVVSSECLPVLRGVPVWSCLSIPRRLNSTIFADPSSSPHSLNFVKN